MRKWSPLGAVTLCVAGGIAVVASAQGGQPTQQQRPPTEQRMPQQQPQQPQGAQPMQQPTASTEICPVGIQGLQVEVRQMPDGGALHFTAAPAQVAELRTRIRRFADMHRQAMTSQQQGAAGGQATGGQATGGQATGQPTGGQATGQAGMQAGAETPRFADETALIHQVRDVRMVEIPNGAELEVRLTRAQQAQLPQLRTELQEDAQAIQQGRCPLALQLES